MNLTDQELKTILVALHGELSSYYAELSYGDTEDKATYMGNIKFIKALIAKLEAEL